MRLQCVKKGREGAASASKTCVANERIAHGEFFDWGGYAMFSCLVSCLLLR